jgi:hypothetical protein
MANSIILAVIAAVGIVVVLILTNTGQENERESEIILTNEIESMYRDIEQAKIQNEQSKNPFIPTAPEWKNRSGPIVIDSYEYILGQKIFVNIDDLDVNDKGRINVYKKNSDSLFLYSSIGFDGSKARNNYYFTPQLSPLKPICNPEDLVGEWVIKFQDTKYPDLTFTIINQLMPGFEDRYAPIINKGNC